MRKQKRPEKIRCVFVFEFFAVKYESVKFNPPSLKAMAGKSEKRKTKDGAGFKQIK